jgi:hypothetical protein
MIEPATSPALSAPSNGSDALLEREAVDVGVDDRVRVSRQRQREVRRLQRPEHGVMVAQRRRTRATRRETFNHRAITYVVSAQGQCMITIGTTASVSKRRVALVAGLGLLLMAVLAGRANFAVLERLIVDGDAAATANAIIDALGIFRLAIIALFGVAILDVIVAPALLIFFDPVHSSPQGAGPSAVRVSDSQRQRRSVIAAQKVDLEIVECAGLDAGANVVHQAYDESLIVNGAECGGEHLASLEQMMQVRPCVVGAGVAVAVLIDL